MVIASPLYFWHFTGQLRMAFDRLFAVSEGYPDYHAPEKEGALLMVAEGDEFEDAVAYYESLMKRMGWRDLGNVLVGGVTKIGDIEGDPGLEKARALGASIA